MGGIPEDPNAAYRQQQQQQHPSNAFTQPNGRVVVQQRSSDFGPGNQLQQQPQQRSQTMGLQHRQEVAPPPQQQRSASGGGGGSGFVHRPAPQDSAVASTSPGLENRPEYKQEFEPVVELISYQPHKTYVTSPPELEMIFARTSAGHQPK